MADYEVRIRITSDMVVTVDAESPAGAMRLAYMHALKSAHQNPVCSKMYPIEATQVIRRGKRKK